MTTFIFASDEAKYAFLLQLAEGSVNAFLSYGDGNFLTADEIGVTVYNDAGEEIKQTAGNCEHGIPYDEHCEKCFPF